METSLIEKFRNEEDTLIKYSDLMKWPINVMKQIIEDRPGAIECTRITSNNKNSVMFTVTMMQGTSWQRHHHDCEEIILVAQGRLKDEVNNREVTNMQLLVFKPYEKHYVVAKEPSLFYVEFKKPQ